MKQLQIETLPKHISYKQISCPKFLDPYCCTTIGKVQKTLHHFL